MPSNGSPNADRAGASSGLQRLPVFLNQWGPSLTVAAAIIGALLSGGVFLLRKVDTLESTAESVAQIRSDLTTLRDQRLPELQDQLSSLADSLETIGDSLDPESRKRLGDLLTGTKETRELLDAMAQDLEDLEATRTELPLLRQKSDQLLEAQEDLKSIHRTDVRELSGEVKDLTGEVAKLEALAELLRPIITKSLAFGTITRNDLSRFYTDKEVDRFFLDAQELIEEGDLVPPGGGGGGGRRFTMAAIQPTGECVGDGDSCFGAVLLLPSLPETVIPDRASISLYSGPLVERVASRLRTEGKAAVQLTAMSPHGSLCSVIANLARSAGGRAASEASRTPAG